MCFDYWPKFLLLTTFCCLLKQSWADNGIKLSTPSDEAAKLFDGAVSQFIGWYDDKQLGGMDSTMKKMLEADPEFSKKCKNFVFEF